jgi:hypothetical protein
MVCAETRPYWAVSSNARQQRELSWNGSEFSVLDRLLGDGRHEVQWFFHLASGLEAERRNGDRWQARWDGGELTCSVRSNVDLDVKFARGQRDPLLGWIAQSSSVVVPAPVVVIAATVEFPLEVEFRFQRNEGRE